MEFIVTMFNDLRKSASQKLLESKLAKIITISNGHRKNNVPKHAQVFATLSEQARAVVASFCAQYQVDPELIYAQMPALKELFDWGAAAPKQNRIAQILSAAVVTLLALVTVGFLSGFVTRLVQFGWALSHHHLH